ncbi:MAG: ATP-binding protein [Mangrovibacterium sp.]
MQELFEHSHKLVADTPNGFPRYMHQKINWRNRLIGLTGPRGVGKTTMILQHIQQNLNLQEVLYVSAEDFYFLEHRLTDLADTFVKHGGKYLFIDEVHKHPEWSRELKLIYDYHAELNVVFTGSSVLDIKKGAFDLSRRAVMYHMQGLSFREYLELFHQISVKQYTLDEVLNHQVNEAQLARPLPLFADYLKQGYYPFALHDDFSVRLRQIINQTLENDIPIYASMHSSTGRKLKQLLSIISKSVPFKPNMSKLGEMLQVSRNNISDYCMWIEDAGMIAQLRSNTNGVRGLGKVDKIYLDNTNLIYSLSGEAANVGNLRETFFLNQLRMQGEVLISAEADFLFEDKTFEIGGKNKGQQQIKNVQQGFVVKDDIERGFMNIIPLWQFGLMY